MSLFYLNIFNKASLYKYAYINLFGIIVYNLTREQKEVLE